MGGIEEKLHHEVFPVDVDATPEVSEACGRGNIDDGSREG